MKLTSLQKACVAAGCDQQGVDADLWSRILLSKHPDKGLSVLEETGCLASTYPEIAAMVGFGGGAEGHKDLWSHTKRVVCQTPPFLDVRWAAMFHDVGKVPTFSRESGKVTFYHHEAVSAILTHKALKRSQHLGRLIQADVVFLVKHLGLAESYSCDWTDSAVRRLYREAGPYFDRTLMLARADITTKHTYKRDRIHALMTELSARAKALAIEDAITPPLPKGVGNSLAQALGITPSKQLGDLKRNLEAEVEAGRLLPHQNSSYYVEYALTHRSELGF